jgi:hypothetical protein
MLFSVSVFAHFMCSAPLEQEETAQVANLVIQLSSDDSLERKEAKRRLIKLGFWARDTVHQATLSTDPELAVSAKEIWAKIKYDIDPNLDEFQYLEAIKNSKADAVGKFLPLMKDKPHAALLILLLHTNDNPNHDILHLFDSLAPFLSHDDFKNLDREAIDYLKKLPVYSAIGLTLSEFKGDLEDDLKRIKTHKELKMALDGFVFPVTKQLGPCARQLQVLVSMRQNSADSLRLLRSLDASNLSLNPFIATVLRSRLLWPPHALACVTKTDAIGLSRDFHVELIRLSAGDLHDFDALIYLQARRLQGEKLSLDYLIKAKNMEYKNLFIYTLDPWDAHRDVFLLSLSEPIYKDVLADFYHDKIMSSMIDCRDHDDDSKLIDIAEKNINLNAKFPYLAFIARNLPANSESARKLCRHLTAVATTDDDLRELANLALIHHDLFLSEFLSNPNKSYYKSLSVIREKSRFDEMNNEALIDVFSALHPEMNTIINIDSLFRNISIDAPTAKMLRQESWRSLPLVLESHVHRSLCYLRLGRAMDALAAGRIDEAKMALILFRIYGSESHELVWLAKKLKRQIDTLESAHETGKIAR